MTQIPLYTIATESTHFDYIISSDNVFFVSFFKQKDCNGRVTFDVRMSQKIKIKFQSCQLVGKLKDNLKDKFYFYTFALLVILSYSKFIRYYSSTLVAVKSLLKDIFL